MNLPKTIKIGHLDYELICNHDDLNSRQRHGECHNFPKPKIVVDPETSPDLLCTLIHEIGEAVQGGLMYETVIKEERHTTFLTLFYMALKENGLLNPHYGVESKDEIGIIT